MWFGQVRSNVGVTFDNVAVGVNDLRSQLDLLREPRWPETNAATEPLSTGLFDSGG